MDKEKLCEGSVGEVSAAEVPEVTAPVGAAAEPVGEVPVPDVFRPKKKQTTVAVLFMVAIALSRIKNFAMPFIIEYGDLLMLMSFLPGLLCAVCWLTLSAMAVNKAVRVAAFIGAGVELLSLAGYVLALAMNNFVMFLVLVLSTFATCYLVGLILNNGGVQGKNRTWINLLALAVVSGIAVNISRFAICDFIDVPDFVLQEHSFNMSVFYQMFTSLLFVLKVVAYWKLARCEAFAGRSTADVMPNFNPVNRWMVMAVVMPLVVFAALLVIYVNYSWFI